MTSEELPMKVVRYTRIDGTPVAGMYFRFKVEQMDKYPDIEKVGRMGYQPDWSAVSLMRGDETLGMIVYHKPTNTNGLHICASYMKPEYRGYGMYRHLWDELLSIAKELGVLYIDSSTHRDNSEMVRLYEKQGRDRMGSYWIHKITE